MYYKYKTLLKNRVPLYGLKQHKHFTQSYYAYLYLSRHGITAHMLSDYLNVSYLNASKSVPKTKEDVIAYNPKKGEKYTKKIINKNNGLRFIPIENMDCDQVRELLLRSKIYMDFGHHPGKDRLPREAAMCGCCVITGNRGSANNEKDVPIPAQFKISSTTYGYANELGELAQAIFSNFNKYTSDFDRYRELITLEHKVFIEQVESIFKLSSNNYEVVSNK
jgi:hypothetical protein